MPNPAPSSPETKALSANKTLAPAFTEIIPKLKQEGIAIVAITHDDRYYHCADRIYRMDYGKLIEDDVNIYARL